MSGSLTTSALTTLALSTATITETFTSTGTVTVNSGGTLQINCWKVVLSGTHSLTGHMTLANNKAPTGQSALINCTGATPCVTGTGSLTLNRPTTVSGGISGVSVYINTASAFTSFFVDAAVFSQTNGSTISLSAASNFTTLSATK
jgi:hypothetical protein